MKPPSSGSECESVFPEELTVKQLNPVGSLNESRAQLQPDSPSAAAP